MSGHHCIDHFRDWLRKGMTRCRFASSAASEARINYVVQLDALEETDLPQQEGFIDDAGGRGTFAIIVFPRVRTSEEIVCLVRTLTKSTRWTTSCVAWRNHAREGAGLIGLNFKTAHGDQSSVMGFAPLGSMPVTRRAPYVALAIWSGKKLNPYKQSKATAVGFIDGPVVDKNGVTVDREAHQKFWDRTVDGVKELLGDPPEDDLKLKDVAFCLPDVEIARLFSNS